MMRSISNNPAEYGLYGLVLAAYILGGSPRTDVSSLILLRPISFIILTLALFTVSRADWEENRVVMLVAIAWFALALLQLVPLPPSLWQALPGRELADRIDSAVGLDIWRPISLVPWRTLNTVFALCLPFAVLLLALRVIHNGRYWIVYILVGLVAASAVLGMLQVISGPDNAFYTYRVSNSDSAVGLFANRNHHAIFLSLGFPILAAALALAPATSEMVRAREWAGAGMGLLLIPFILTTQSRAGIIVAAICVVLSWWVYQSPVALAQKRRRPLLVDPRLIFGVLAVGGLVLLTTVFAATNAVERLARLGREDDELRLQIWPIITDILIAYLPFGSGMGTFVEIYQTAEPTDMLQPAYVNHAHNDWLEVILTGGLPAAMIVILANFVIIRMTTRRLRESGSVRETVVRRLGASILIVMALASLYDYPLRTPALAALLALGVAMAAGARPNLSST